MYSNHRKKKSISLLLAFVMVLSMFISVIPQTVIAENAVEEQISNDSKAAEVDRLISRFGAKEEVSEEYIIKVQAARTAYDALTEEAKALVMLVMSKN